MHDEYPYPNEIPNTGIGFSSTDGCPGSVPEPFVSLVRSSQTGSRNDTEEDALRLIGDDKARPIVEVLDPPIACNVPAKATEYGHTFALLVPQAVIPRHERDDIIEVRVSRRAEPADEYTLYTTHKPGYKRAYLDLFQLRPSRGEVYIIRSVGKYSAVAFASEYNAGKPKGLENTELRCDGRAFRMKVDGTEVELRNARFRAYQGQVILDGELGNAGPVKLAKSFSGFAIRLRDHSPVTSLRVVSGGVVMAYARTDHDAYPHRRQVSVGESGANSTPQEELILRFAVLGPWCDSKNVFVVAADRRTKELVRTRLASARTLDEFRKIKGDIGEEIVRQTLSEVGMTLVADHPFNTQVWLRGCERLGPDLLVRVARGPELYYIEVKWWGDPDEAYVEAEEQVLEDWKKHPTFDGKVIAGAYAAIVSWNAEEDTILLQFTSVRPSWA